MIILRISAFVKILKYMSINYRFRMMKKKLFFIINDKSANYLYYSNNKLIKSRPNIVNNNY